MGETKPAELLRFAASAEKYSNHPTAKALAQLAGEAGVPLAEPQNFSETAGRGVKAEVDGAKFLVGRAQWLKDNGVTEDFVKSVDLNETEGWSLIFVARDGQCIGWVGLQDQTRAEAKESLAELKEAGVRRIAMISGDRQAVATRVAAEIGCEEAKGECLPQNKVEFVRGDEGQGLSRGGGRRRCERRAGAGGGRHRHRDGRGGQRSGHPQRDDCADEQRPAPAAVSGEAFAQHPRGHQPEFPVRRAVHHRRPDARSVRYLRPDCRGRFCTTSVR